MQTSRLTTVCLCAPVGSALLRKLVPGQPAAFEIASVFLIAVCFLLVLQRFRPLPRFLGLAYGYWALLQILYAFPAILDNWAVGFTAIATRVLPMAMVVIAHSTIHSDDDLKSAFKLLGLLAIILVPAAIVTARVGNYAVPVLFQPTAEISLVGKSSRLGMDTVSTVFSNPASASMSTMAIGYMSMAILSLARTSRQESIFWYLVLASSVVLTFLTTRRGALIGLILGLLVFSLAGTSRYRWPKIFTIVLCTLGVGWLDFISSTMQQFQLSRLQYTLDLNFGHRLTQVFFPFVSYWAQRMPLGSYLGAAGPEARVMGILVYEQYPIEVGAAQLIVETGILGAIVFPVVLFLITLRLLRDSRGLSCQHSVSVLLLFNIAFFVLYYGKEAQAMNNVSIAQVLFWSVPGICYSIILANHEREASVARRVNVEAFCVCTGGVSR